MITSPIRKKEDIELLKEFFLTSRNYRDYTLFVAGINTALRISDLLALKWKDIYNFNNNSFQEHIYVKEQKTGKNTCIALNQSCISAFDLLKNSIQPQSSDEYVFFSNNNRYIHISRNRAYHIIKKAAQQLGIEGNISCHSLRKTFGYHAWKCGTPPALIMNIYNHSNIEITKRYLCIDQDEKDELFFTVNL